MTYPLSSDYITALKAVRAEFDKYPELEDIKIMGPEDLMGSDAYGMWEYGGPVHKNLQYLKNIEADPQASEAVDFYNIHGYAGDGVSSAGSTPTLWDWWANGWTTSPAGGVPTNVAGFKSYGKKSWMTETSGEDTPWLSPSSGFPNNGGWSVALKIHQALTTGEQSAWIYWQLTDGGTVKGETLTDSTLRAGSPKYVALKHFAKYIRPNAQRVKTDVAGSSTLSASSYVHDANKTVTTVLINSANSPQSVKVKLPTTPFNITTLQTYTSDANNLWKSGSAAVQNREVSVTVPAFGVVTLHGAGTTTVQPTATATTPTPTLPACPTVQPPAATPQGNRPRAYMPLTYGGGTAQCR
jgi:O-glycosyl hydrolase